MVIVIWTSFMNYTISAMAGHQEMLGGMSQAHFPIAVEITPML